jgi:hypothetical protein
MKLETGQLVPAVTLPGAGDRPAVSLKHGRGPRAIVTLHGAGCEDCCAWCVRLAAASDRAAEWGGRIIVVLPASDEGDEAADLRDQGLTLVRDPEGAIAEGRTAVIVTDEWGEVFFATDAGDGHAWPSADEIVDWLRFAAIQCPECEAPEGEWRSL